MVSRSRLAAMACVLACAVAVAAAEPPAESLAADRAAGSGRNVLVTITVGKLEGGQRSSLRSYRLVAVDGGRSAHLFAGSRVPIPSTTFNSQAQGGTVIPYTSYTYQSVGFSAELSAEVLADRTVRLEGTIESSTVTGSLADRPSIDTQMQTVNAVLRDGVPLEIARVDDRSERSGVLEIRAEILE